MVEELPHRSLYSGSCRAWLIRIKDIPSGLDLSWAALQTYT
uniref:Uncharacterized protein n=1 Tax=Talaromyces marneffei PM1 TaxID=1077442 RepID=A0A093X884_TALMA